LKEELKHKLKQLPESPGVYQYFDTNGKIIYVGKAKNLKKRVSSYFNREIYENRKTLVLVKNIANLEYIVVNTEYDALLLENTLIKKHQPKFNINLKDDKTYPYICIKNENFPRVFHTRNIIKDGSQYFGPYTNLDVMYTLLAFIKEFFTIRTCTLKLTQENIKAQKFKVCLEYHLKNCKGPCVAYQTEDEYKVLVVQIKDILKGNTNDVVKVLEQEMEEAAQKYEFEKAHVLKQKLERIIKFQAKSTVVNPSITNVDVFSIVDNTNSFFVNYLKVNNGAIIQSYNSEIKKKLDETSAQVLEIIVVELREKFKSENREIILPFELPFETDTFKVTVPQKGDKKKLLELSEKNAENLKREVIKQIQLTNPEEHTNRIMAQMKKDLRLTQEPRHIECFDNSNIQGQFAVSAMTVFKDGKPSKKDYRHFNVKTVEGPNDFDTMKEVIYRRYKRAIDENQDLPQLIVIDGGKGQLSSAIESLEKLEIMGKVGIIGIAKKLEELYYPNDPIPLYLDKRSETLKIIQHIRDEAHRFGITHHRNKRSKETFVTELNQIKGISEKTSTLLLSTFGSVFKIKETSIEELEKHIGKAKASLVYNYFNS
jgi:excinuclease ABC subunit C